MSKTRIEVFKSQFIPDFKVFEVHIPLEYVKKLKDENWCGKDNLALYIYLTPTAAVEFNLHLTNKMAKKKLNQDIYKHF